MLSRTFDVLGLLWPSMGLGGAVILAATCLGWIVGRHRTSPLVHLVAFWVRRVVIPLVRRRSWAGRAMVIFLNNISILTLILAAGAWPVAALSAAATVGLSLVPRFSENFG